MENNETKDATSNVESDNGARIVCPKIADTVTIVALMIKQVMLDSHSADYEFCNEVVKCINQLIAEINDGTDTLHELKYHHPPTGTEEIVDYVYDHVKRSIAGGKCGSVNKYMAFNDFIKDGISDAVATMNSLASSAYLYGNKLHTQKYTTYKTLTNRLNALSIIIARLNPNIGSIINAVIGACDNIDVSQFIDLEQQHHPVQYDHLGRPVQQNGYDQYHGSLFRATKSFTQSNDSTKK